MLRYNLSLPTHILALIYLGTESVRVVMRRKQSKMDLNMMLRFGIEWTKVVVKWNLIKFEWTKVMEWNLLNFGMPFIHLQDVLHMWFVDMASSKQSSSIVTVPAPLQ